MTLTEGQWAITTGESMVVMGPGTPYNVAGFEIGEPDMRNSDKPRAREDGDEFGRDYRGGRTITFDLNALSDPDEPIIEIRHREVLNHLAVLESAWDAELARTQPGATSVLSYCRAGQTRRVFGRPRRFQPISTMDWAGNVPVTCDFRTKGHHFYDDTENAVTLGYIPADVGGFTPPLIGSLIMSGQGVGAENINIGGTGAAWLVARINGPISSPTVQVPGQWSATLNTTLAVDQWVLVDPSPWARTVLRNDGANLSGVFTADSQRLSGWRLPPGQHEVLLRGNDPTGTSSLNLFWRGVHNAY